MKAFTEIAKKVLGGETPAVKNLSKYFKTDFLIIQSPWTEGERFLTLEKYATEEEIKEINRQMREYDNRIYEIRRQEYD